MVKFQNHFPEFTDEQLNLFSRLEGLYTDWNSKINVISRKDIEHFNIRHLLHSLAIAKVVNFESGSKVLDVGTGGGFPGIPLAIVYPDVQFHLVDSIGKKIRVVQAVADELGLKNVTAQQARAESLNNKYDYVVSRAVTQLDTFCKWIWKYLPADSNQIKGLYALKGGDLTEEIENFKRLFRIHTSRFITSLICLKMIFLRRKR